MSYRGQLQVCWSGSVHVQFDTSISEVDPEKSADVAPGATGLNTMEHMSEFGPDF